MINLFVNKLMEMYSLFCVVEKIRTTYIHPKRESNESIKLKNDNEHIHSTTKRYINNVKELFIK